MCSWCRRVNLGSEGVEVEEAVERLRLFELESLPQISHGCCEPCSQRILEI